MFTDAWSPSETIFRWKRDVEGPFQPVGEHFRVADERFHLGLAEVAAMRPSKAAAEALGAGDADPDAVDLQRDAVALEHVDAGGLEDPPDLLLAAGVVIVVAQHGDHRDLPAAQVFGQHLDLLRATAARQVAGEEQQISSLREMFEARPEDVLRAESIVQVADRRDSDHDTGSSPSGSLAETTAISLTIS